MMKLRQTPVLIALAGALALGACREIGAHDHLPIGEAEHPERREDDQQPQHRGAPPVPVRPTRHPASASPDAARATQLIEIGFLRPGAHGRLGAEAGDLTVL